MITEQVFAGIRRAVENYTDDRVLGLNIVADPTMQDSFAVRAFINSNFVDFIAIMKAGEFSTEDLNEVEFKSWPPISNPNKLRFL